MMKVVYKVCDFFFAHTQPLGQKKADSEEPALP